LFVDGNKKEAFKTVEETVDELEKLEKDLPQEERRVLTLTTRSGVEAL
jgi:hypothetical protein